MNYTTNFNLNKPEGTDLYNHLTVDNPNMDTIDAAMQANKLASVGAATELVSGTVHAITRTDSNQNIFKFKATGDFKAGDTITVDGVSVNAYTTDGQQLLNDAYVLSAEVLCILDGASLWVLVNKTPDASEISFNGIDSVKDVVDGINTSVGDVNTSTQTISSGVQTTVIETDNNLDAGDYIVFATVLIHSPGTSQSLYSIRGTINNNICEEEVITQNAYATAIKSYSTMITLPASAKINLKILTNKNIQIDNANITCIKIK